MDNIDLKSYSKPVVKPGEKNIAPKKAILSIAWPYANGDLHIGHIAGSFLPAAILNRYLRMRGTDVIMVSGSDMHGTPISVSAWKAGVRPEEYAINQHARHIEVIKSVRAEFSNYTRTSTVVHSKVTHKVFEILYKQGYIF